MPLSLSSETICILVSPTSLDRRAALSRIKGDLLVVAKSFNTPTKSLRANISWLLSDNGVRSSGRYSVPASLSLKILRISLAYFLAVISLKVFGAFVPFSAPVRITLGALETSLVTWLVRKDLGFM